MSDFRAIEIDLDVHKLVEAERRSFGESANDALRRLLGLGDAKSTPIKARSGRNWSGLGVELGHGTKLRMTYNGVTHFGVIDDGAWLVEGKRYSSPSGAASDVARTKKGERTRLDGWNYWNVQLPGSDLWVSLIELWRQADAAKKLAK